MAHAHYVFARGPQVRDLIDPKYTVAAYVSKRFTEATTPISIAYNVLMPFLQELNTHLEQHIDTVNKTGTDDEDLRRDIKESSIFTSFKFGEFAARTAMQTAAVSYLLKQNTPLSLSIVHAFDSYQRLHFEYYSRLLTMLRLPARWAVLVGPKPTASDVASFEKRPLHFTAAAEDATKRHIIFFVTDMTVGAAVEVIKANVPQVAPCAARKVERSKSSVGAIVLQHWRSTLERYVCVVVGAAIGSQISSSGSGEYFGEVVGMAAAATISAYRLRTVTRGSSLRN